MNHLLGDDDWSRILDRLESNQCAFFLGHGLLTDSEGTAHYDKACNAAKTSFSPKIDQYYADCNLFLVQSRAVRDDIAFKIKSYYKTVEPDKELYRQLAQIPATLYISISPDDFLEKALGTVGRSVAYSDSSHGLTGFEASKDCPLVYHIFGSNTDINSLRLTHDNLYSFFKNIFGGSSLPEAVQHFFNEDASGEVIFLGFDFKAWYVTLLLRLFNLVRPDPPIRSRAYLYKEPPEEYDIYAKQNFKVEYVDDGLKEFVAKLWSLCKERGILRPLPDDTKKGGDGSAKIFISYDKGDLATALKMRDILAKNGLSVITGEDMAAGDTISKFILNSIRNSTVTVSLVSANSLISAWTAMETNTSLADADIRARTFIPCKLDTEIDDREFTGRATDKIDAEIKEIRGLMIEALSQDRGVEDLQDELTRYKNMKVNISGIIGKLRDTFCIDLRPEKFDANMPKIVDDIKAAAAKAAALS